MMSMKFAVARRLAATATLSFLLMWSAGFAFANVPDPGIRIRCWCRCCRKRQKTERCIRADG